jgi:N-acetylglucosaminyldiphosphoundecaprenol N-acetyl-beta-D-mannosaminyltransferase
MTFFNINYEFDVRRIHSMIAQRLHIYGSDYICAADGVVLNTANRHLDYLKIVNAGMFSICDSSYVPLYIKWIYGIRYKQYTGSQIFEDIVKSGKYRMIFLGASEKTLNKLRNKLSVWNPAVMTMTFKELPFRNVDEFDYMDIAQTIENDHADIIWIALGAPKQEYFMYRLRPYLSHGVMIAVGAVFKFFSGEERRAPKWIINLHMEFIFRLIQAPQKQLQRCAWIIATLPRLLYNEWKVANRKLSQSQTLCDL